MSNQRFRIPSGGIGEIEYNIERKHWFKIEASKFNKDKAIPFLKLINDLVGAFSKYYRNQSRNGRYEYFAGLAQEILKTANGKKNILTIYFIPVIFILLITALKIIDNF